MARFHSDRIARTLTIPKLIRHLNSKMKLYGLKVMLHETIRDDDS